MSSAAAGAGAAADEQQFPAQRPVRVEVVRAQWVKAAVAPAVECIPLAPTDNIMPLLPTSVAFVYRRPDPHPVTPAYVPTPRLDAAPRASPSARARSGRGAKAPSPATATLRGRALNDNARASRSSGSGTPSRAPRFSFGSQQSAQVKATGSHTGNVDDDFMAVAGLKASLSAVLSEYPVLVGRLRARPDRCDDSMEVKTVNTGVVWVDARVRRALCAPDDCQPETVPLPRGRDLVPSAYFRGEVPVVIMATRFSCGSLVITVSACHVVLDAQALFRFVNHWAALHRAHAARGGGADFAAAVAAIRPRFPVPTHNRMQLLGPQHAPAPGYEYDASNFMAPGTGANPGLAMLMAALRMSLAEKTGGLEPGTSAAAYGAASKPMLAVWLLAHVLLTAYRQHIFVQAVGLWASHLLLVILAAFYAYGTPTPSAVVECWRFCYLIGAVLWAVIRGKPRLPEDAPEPIAAHWPPIPVPTMTTRLFHFSAAECAALKAAASVGLGPGEWISTNDALCAHIWMCATRARIAAMSPADVAAAGSSGAGIAVNGRQRLQPKVPEQFCGTVVAHAVAHQPLADLCDPAALPRVARLLRVRVQAMTNDRYRAEARWVDAQPHKHKVATSFRAFFTRDVSFTQWTQLHAYDADFGGAGGRPSYVGQPNIGLDGMCVQSAVPPCFRDVEAGGQVVHFGLLKPHMTRLLADPQWRRFRPNVMIPASAVPKSPAVRSAAGLPPLPPMPPVPGDAAGARRGSASVTAKGRYLLPPLPVPTRRPSLPLRSLLLTAAATADTRAAADSAADVKSASL